MSDCPSSDVIATSCSGPLGSVRRLLSRSPTSIDALRGGALSIGNFDGVHRGHQQMVERLRRLADELSAPAIVLTFDPHPIEVLAPAQAPARLMSIERRVEALLAAGADAVIVEPATPALLALTAAEFFQQILVADLRVRALVEGPNFYFGKGRGGNVALLEQWCPANQIRLEVQPPIMIDGQLVSSSAIRSLLEVGEVAHAARLLGRPYLLEGVVTTGAQRGRTLGFPTANLDQVPTLVPASGVYAGIATVAGRRTGCAMHIGPIPTVGDARARVEAHLLDFDGNLYGQQLSLVLIRRLRGVVKFDSLDQLQQQILADIASTRAALADVPV